MSRNSLTTVLITYALRLSAKPFDVAKIRQNQLDPIIPLKANKDVLRNCMQISDTTEIPPPKCAKTDFRCRLSTCQPQFAYNELHHISFE